MLSNIECQKNDDNNSTKAIRRSTHEMLRLKEIKLKMNWDRDKEDETTIETDAAEDSSLSTLSNRCSSGKTSEYLRYHDSNFVAVSPSLHSGLRSCMKVRTLDESLHSVRIIDRDSQRSNQSDKSSDRTVSTISVDDNDNLTHLFTDRLVNFGNIEIREYPRMLGDNPSVSFGPPLSIDWDYYSDSVTVPVDEYESTRPSRRRTVEMVIPRMIREDMIRDSGHSRSEMAKAVREIQKIKNKRLQTVNNLKIARIEEGLESAKRKLKRAVLRRKKDRELKKLWEKQAERAAQMICEENQAAAKKEEIQRKKEGKKSSSFTLRRKSFDIHPITISEGD